MELSADLLCDKSVLGHLHRDIVFNAFVPLVEAGRVAICSPTILEQQTSARDRASLERMHATLIGRLERIPLSDAACARAEEVQRLLVSVGRHRGVSPPDLLVAAAAELSDMTVLHFDHDFDLIAGVTGQPTRWIVASNRLASAVTVANRPRNTGLHIQPDPRAARSATCVASLICAQCASSIDDQRDGEVLLAVDEDGSARADRWVASHAACARTWAATHPGYDRGWPLGQALASLLRHSSVREPQQGLFDLSDMNPA